MSAEWHSWVDAYDEEFELAVTVGQPVTDAELDLLCELACGETLAAVPGQALAANRIAETRGFPPVVVEDPPGRWCLNPDIAGFAARVFEDARSTRRWARSQDGLVTALEELPEEHFRLLQTMCQPRHPLESAVRGIGIDDPDGFVAAVNTAARRHGISDPVVEASAWTVRATTPPDLLVGAVLVRLQNIAEQRASAQLAGFVASLSTDETALLRHVTGFDIADEDDLRRLDPAGDVINEKAHSTGLTGQQGPIPVLLRRDEHDHWQLHPGTKQRLRNLWKPAS